MAEIRPLRLPPEDFTALPLPVTDVRPCVLWRVHLAAYSAIHFSIKTGHRFSHPDSPFPLLYAGATPEACLLEVFGDELLSSGALFQRVWRNYALSSVSVPQLRICDFTDDCTWMTAGVDRSALADRRLETPQAWGLAVQRHSANFDGLRYPSRFGDKPCFVLFERGNLAAKLKEKRAGALESLPQAIDFLDKFKIALL